MFELAKSQLSTQEPASPTEQARIDSRLAVLTEESALICRNLARRKDEETYAEIEAERTKIKDEILQLQVSRQRLTCGLNSVEGESQTKVEHEVEKALSKLEDIQRIASSPEARLEIREMLQELGCRVGLSFIETIKGKKRPIRKLGRRNNRVRWWRPSCEAAWQGPSERRRPEFERSHNTIRQSPRWTPHTSVVRRMVIPTFTNYKGHTGALNKRRFFQ